jgi:hypothetical protein
MIMSKLRIAHHDAGFGFDSLHLNGVNVLCMPLFSTMNDLIWGSVADAARLSLTNKPSPLKLRRTV